MSRSVGRRSCAHVAGSRRHVTPTCYDEAWQKLKAVKARSIYRCNACGHVEAKRLGKCSGVPGVELARRGARAGGGAAAERERRLPTARHRCRSPRSVEISAKDRHSTLIGEPRSRARRRAGRGIDGAARRRSRRRASPRCSSRRSRGLARDRGVLYATGEESVAQTAMRARRASARRRSGSCSSRRRTSSGSSRTPTRRGRRSSPSIRSRRCTRRCSTSILWLARAGPRVW